MRMTLCGSCNASSVALLGLRLGLRLQLLHKLSNAGLFQTSYKQAYSLIMQSRPLPLLQAWSLAWHAEGVALQVCSTATCIQADINVASVDVLQNQEGITYKGPE